MHGSKLGQAPLEFFVSDLWDDFHDQKVHYC